MRLDKSQASLPLFAGFSGEQLDDAILQPKSGRLFKNARVVEKGAEFGSYFLLLDCRAYNVSQAGEQTGVRLGGRESCSLRPGHVSLWLAKLSASTRKMTTPLATCCQ
jgi:hypothetical protein